MSRKLVKPEDLDGFQFRRAWVDKKGRWHIESTAGRHIRFEGGFSDDDVWVTEPMDSADRMRK